LKEALQQLCAFAHAPPGKKKWTDFYTRLMLLLWFFEGAEDDAGRLSREILREIDTLWIFLDEAGVEPTNNRAERALRFAVLWRKRSNGTQSEKGNRWGGAAVVLPADLSLEKPADLPSAGGCREGLFQRANAQPELAGVSFYYVQGDRGHHQQLPGRVELAGRVQPRVEVRKPQDSGRPAGEKNQPADQQDPDDDVHAHSSPRSRLQSRKTSRHSPFLFWKYREAARTAMKFKRA
jgi:transposase